MVDKCEFSFQLGSNHVLYQWSPSISPTSSTPQDLQLDQNHTPKRNPPNTPPWLGPMRPGSNFLGEDSLLSAYTATPREGVVTRPQIEAIGSADADGCILKVTAQFIARPLFNDLFWLCSLSVRGCKRHLVLFSYNVKKETLQQRSNR